MVRAVSLSHQIAGSKQPLRRFCGGKACLDFSLLQTTLMWEPPALGLPFRRSMLVGNGKDTSFWHDKWCGNVSLKDNFPQLFEINKEQFWSVATMKNRNWRLTFRRWLHEDLQSQLRRLQDILYICSVNDEPWWKKIIF